MSERAKAFSRYVVCIFLPKFGSYYLKDYKPREFEKMKSFIYNSHRYNVNKDYVFYLHGWAPWFDYNPWNVYRQFYNRLWTWYNATGIIFFREPPDFKNWDFRAGREIPSEPLGPMVIKEKWTPALIKQVDLSPLEQIYNSNIKYGHLKLDWKIILVIFAVLIVILLLVTGRFPGVH